jgi:hypothetical protein
MIALRPYLSLDGTWQFALDTAGTGTPDSQRAWQSIDVPGPWQAQSDDLRFAQGVAWYQRSFEVPAHWAGQQILLCFGAVEHLTEIWVNHQFVGSHAGGYLPFEFDISEQVAPGHMAILTLKVTDPDNDRKRYPVPFAELPHGKQSWYGPLSGIWQSVRLEARAQYHIQQLKISPNTADQIATLLITLNQPAPVGSVLQITIYDPNGQLVYNEPLPCATQRMELAIAINSPVLWELDAPARYTVTASLQAMGQADTYRSQFGFRTIETRDGSLWLNGKPLLLRGALDQDYYPDLISTPPSYEYLVAQAQLAKRMGLNCLRCHIKIADPRYLEAADEVGLLVWAELPNWAHWTPTGAEYGLQVLEAAIERDWNHPSVVIWTIINESWGIDQTNPEHRAWLRSAYQRIKRIAGDRLVVDNSACFNNVHLKSDLDDYHFYAAMPDERPRWREWVHQFANRPKWSYGAVLPAIPAGTDRWILGAEGYGAALPEVERTGDEPLIVSEFGNWGLPSLHALRGPQGKDPWWFETGDDWGDGVVYPHGVEQRFARLGLAHIFGDYERFAAATRRAELEALQFEIEEMRRYPNISGYVITEFTDVHWECNGLLDMRRNPKLPMNALAALNADTVLIPDREHGALYAGTSQRMPLLASHWGATLLENLVVRCTLSSTAATVRFAAAQTSITPRATVTLGDIQINASQVQQPIQLMLQIELWQDQQCIASTSQQLAIYPQPVTAQGWHVYNAPELQQRLATLGYPIVATPGSAPTLTTRFDEVLRNRVLQGEHVVLLAEDAQALQATVGPLAIRSRAGTHWQGSWASSFAWMAGTWPGDGILDDTFMAIMPTHIVAGFAQTSFAHHVQAGLCVGWIQKPVALLGAYRLGRGQVTITTFRLREAIGSNPVADWVFGQLGA